MWYEDLVLDFKNCNPINHLPTALIRNTLWIFIWEAFLNGSSIKDFLCFYSTHSTFQRPGLKLQQTSLVRLNEDWLVTRCHCSLVSDVNSGNCWIYIKYFHPSVLFWKDPRRMCAYNWWKIKDADQENCFVEMLLALGCCGENLGVQYFYLFQFSCMPLIVTQLTFFSLNYWWEDSPFIRRILRQHKDGLNSPTACSNPVS